MKIIGLSEIENSRDLANDPVFFGTTEKVLGMIRRSSFNNLYPIVTDGNKDFDGLPNELHLDVVCGFLISKGYILYAN